MVTKRVRQTIIVLAFAAGSLSLTACGGRDEGTASGGPPAGTSPENTTAAAAAEPVTIELKEENASGQTGTATLKPAGERLDVELEVTPPKKFKGAFQHAHVHDVTCAEYRKLKDFNAQLGTVVDGLSDLSRGKSTSTVAASLADRATGSFSINVHEEDTPYTVVACGDIPKLTAS